MKIKRYVDLKYVLLMSFVYVEQKYDKFRNREIFWRNIFPYACFSSFFNQNSLFTNPIIIFFQPHFLYYLCHGKNKRSNEKFCSDRL